MALRLIEPVDYQVVQAHEGQATVRFTGTSLPADGATPAGLVRIGIPGAPELVIDAPVVGGKFSAVVAIPRGGWRRAVVTELAGGQELDSAVIDHFAAGEVFIAAGQSNSTNCGQYRSAQFSGLVAAHSEQGWQLARDPLPGPADGSSGGSPWLAFGDALTAGLGCAVGIGIVGYGGSSVTQWQPGGPHLDRLLDRLAGFPANGLRAVLWHQGETDYDLAAADYERNLRRLIKVSRTFAGWEIPWFVAGASYDDPRRSRSASVRMAQNAVCAEGLALPGPDSDLLTGGNRDYDGDGVHFSPLGLRNLGLAWAESVLPHCRPPADGAESSGPASVDQASVPAEVRAFLDSVTPSKRQRDARTLLAMMARITGQPPVLERSAIGFGDYHYQYESGRSGNAPAAGFAPRKAAMTVYLMDGVGSHAAALSRLGPHTQTVGCLYLKDLAEVDLAVLEQIIAKSYATLTAGTYGKRARDGGTNSQ
ncbi:MAG: sialate O-acetylesterase [Candidatus Nanopelagicales bacterium]